MDNIGGAERVTLILKRELDCDLYTTRVNKEKIEKMGFEFNNIESFTNPFNRAPFKQQYSMLLFHLFKPEKNYDKIIICGDWAMSTSNRNKNTIWYVHSPTRELWDLNEYIKKTKIPLVLRPVFNLWVWLNRNLSRYYVKKIPTLVCNSNTVKKRIKKYLNRDAIVIYPPVDTKNYTYKKNGDYWLSVNRFINHKRIEMQIEAFSKMPNEKLIIAGSYEEAPHFKEYLKQMELKKTQNITFMHSVDEKKLIELYSSCKGFITTPIDEDFGLTAVEAMASGKPVIAPNSGGYTETVINGKTGILIDDINSDKIISTVKKISKELKKSPLKYRDACIKQSKKFDTKEFMKKMNRIIKK
jgi:glycosyltransferase involved in cell wall biosynthesis